MYNFCFKSCLVSLAIATALGVAAVWVPEAWYDVGAKLLWTDVIMFVGATVGAVLCYIGVIADTRIIERPTSQQTTREISRALRKELSKSPTALYGDK